MARVGPMLARGIAIAAVFFMGGRLSGPAPSRLDRSLRFIRSQNFSPVLEVARRRIEGHFSREREERFLDALFSMSGKWKAATRGREAYERFVARTFERIVLEAEALAARLEKIREDWSFSMAAAENRLLAVVYDDLSPARPGLSMSELRVDYARLSASLAPLVLRDLGINFISIGGSEVASILLTSALASSGIIAGASAGAWTFGAGLVAGLAVGLVIDETAGAAYEEVARRQLHLK